MRVLVAAVTRFIVGTVVLRAFRPTKSDVIRAIMEARAARAAQPRGWHPLAAVILYGAVWTLVLGTVALFEAALITTLWVSIGSIMLCGAVGLIGFRRIARYALSRATEGDWRTIPSFASAPALAAIAGFSVMVVIIFLVHNDALGTTKPYRDALQKDLGAWKTADATAALTADKILLGYLAVSHGVRRTVVSLVVKRVGTVTDLEDGKSWQALYDTVNATVPVSYKDAHPAQMIKLQHEAVPARAPKPFPKSPPLSSFYPTFFAKLQTFFQAAATVLAALTIALVFSRSQIDDREHVSVQYLWIGILYAAIAIVASVVGSLPSIPKYLQAILLGYVAAGFFTLITALITQSFREARGTP